MHSQLGHNDQKGKHVNGEVRIGKGPTSSLQADTQARTHFPRNDTTKEVTGIFMTRFKPKITANQVDNYINLNFGVEVKSEKTRTRYDTYSSFYIRADRPLRDMFLNQQGVQIWSSGLLVKPYV